MTNLSGDLEVGAQGLFETSDVQLQKLGERITSNDGRTYRYGKAGAVALVRGKLQQSAAEITAHQDLTPVAANIGDTQITVALGATAATANYYSGGLAIVTVTPGEGYAYRIKSNPAANLSTSIVITLDDPLIVALTTSSRIDLVPNPYNNLIINPASASSAPAGAAVVDVPIGYYSWIQVGGQASLLADGAITVGTALVASNGTAGAVEPLAGVQAPIGIALSGIATTQYGAVRLTLQ